MDAQGFWARAGSTQGGTTSEDASPDAAEAAFLTSARDARDLIAEAKHVVMERHDLDADQALDLMRFYSRGCDRPLRDVALKITHGTWLPGS